MLCSNILDSLMMNPVLALLIGIACYIVVSFAYLGLRTLIKKEPFLGLLKDFDNLFKFGAFFLLDLLFVLIICLSYSRTNQINFVWLGLGCSVVAVCVPFKSLFLKIKNKQFKEINVFKCFAYLGPVLILVLEVILFSNVSSKKDDNLINVSFDSPLIVENTGIKEDDRITFDSQRCYMTFDNTQHQMKSLYLDLSCKEENAIQIDVCTANELSGSYGFRVAYKFDSRYSEFEYFDLSKFSDANYIRLYFVIDETNIKSISSLPPVYLHTIAINQAFPYVFNIVRFALLATGYTLVLLAFKKCVSLEYKEVDKIKLLKKIVLILCGVGAVYILINSLICSSSHYVLVDSLQESDPNVNIYHQLFLAFKNGRASLGYEPSPELVALQNPYVPSNRDGVWYLWDHAYYNGKYYCYYGCAPVILVMFPIYLLTGFKYVPTILLMEEIGTLFSLTFFALFVLESVKLLFKKINYPVLILVLVTAVFTSLVLSNNIYKVGYYNEGIYRIPYSYGLGFLFLIFYMLFKAYKDDKNRIIHLGVLGLGVVLMMATRPTLFVVLILTAPIFIKMIIQKGITWKKKIIDFAPMVGVIMVGAVFICYYNYIRYDSIFEFGQTYQLTLADNTKLAYSAKGIAPTLFHFFVLPSSFNASRFPFFDYGYYDGVPAYHNYNNGAIGLLMFPIFYSFFTMPFVFDKEDDLTLRITYYLSPLALFILAFTTYCFAGVCPRYVVEITALASAFVVVPTIKLFTKLNKKAPHVAMGYLLVSCLFSGFFSFNLLFCGFDGWKESDQHGLLEVVRSVFNNYNI